MSELYENLLKATDNIDDITNEKYATVTKVDGDYCSVQEEDTLLEHSQVPVLNKLPCDTGDKVVLGFVDNSLYNPVVIGTVDGTSVQEKLISGVNLKTINNNSLLGEGNITIEGGGGGSGVVMVGSFRINDDGDLIVTLPTGTLNPYHIDENGDLIYSTNPQIGGK